MNADNDLRVRLVAGGLESAALFFLELRGCLAFAGGMPSALTQDVLGVYLAWCARHRIPSMRPKDFVASLRNSQQIQHYRLRYCLNGRKLGPHGVLLFNESRENLGAQIAQFRAWAATVKKGDLS